MPARDLTRWEQNEDGSWRMKPRESELEDSPSAPTVAGTAESEDYSEMTLVELRDELVSRGLSKTGNKAELVARLQEADSA